MRPILLLAVLAVAGCASTAVPAPPAPDPLPTRRDADGLLQRPELQALVDLQVRRDGAALAEALGSPDSLVRARAAFALGSVQDEDAIDALRLRLDDPVPAVRADAAFALGQTADSSAGVALAISLRREATPAVTAELLDALGKIGGRADLSAVLDAPLPAELEPSRALALARFGARGVVSDAWAGWVADHLQDADEGVREGAAYALTRSPVDAWRSRAGAVRAALDALAGDPARADLARAVGRLEDPADIPRLGAALESDPDWRTRVNAARALGAFDEAAARALLARAVDDPNPHVAQTAGGALASAAATPEAVDLAAAVLSDDRPWPVQAALLPLLAPSRPAVVLDWSDRQTDPFAKAAALSALGASDDGAVLSRLFTAARSDDTRLAVAALGTLRQRWAAGGYGARRFYEAFAHGLRRADLATTSAAAPALADSAFWPLGAGASSARSTMTSTHPPTSSRWPPSSRPSGASATGPRSTSSSASPSPGTRRSARPPATRSTTG